MSQRAVEHCIGRLVTDDQFRRLAGVSLAHACMQAGLELTPGEIALLSLLDFDTLAQLSRHLDPGLHRTGITLGL